LTNLLTDNSNNARSAVITGFLAALVSEAKPMVCFFKSVAKKAVFYARLLTVITRRIRFVMTSGSGLTHFASLFGLCCSIFDHEQNHEASQLRALSSPSESLEKISIIRFAFSTLRPARSSMREIRRGDIRSIPEDKDVLGIALRSGGGVAKKSRFRPATHRR
jgi:hypothetical protein